MEFTELAWLVPGLSAAIAALVQMLKRYGLQAKYAGLVAVALGLVIGALYALEAGESAVLGAIGGFLSGATASGIYSGTKALLKKEASE